MNRAIYLRNGQTPDEAIERTLLDGGVFVEYTHTIAETLQAIYDYGRDVDTTAHVSASLLVVAEVQCGGIPLLTVIREEMRDAPQVMLLDRSSGKCARRGTRRCSWGPASICSAATPRGCARIARAL